MARYRLEELLGRKPTLVYIAGNVADAEKAERLLSSRSMDYAVSIEPFLHTSVLGGTYPGLFIYVPSPDSRLCRQYLESNGLTDTVDLDEESP